MTGMPSSPPPGAIAAALASSRIMPDREREFSFNEKDFSVVAQIIYQEAGITLPEAKRDHVYSRLARRLRALGMTSFAAYCDHVKSAGGADELRKMISALTTNVTRFFREPHHFTHLAENLLPEIVQAARRGGRIRLWSAGCSTGEEPYSMAFTLLRAFPEAARHDVRILATDIDPEVLAVGRRGEYGADIVDQLPDWARARVEPAGDGAVRVGEAARKLVDFRQLNLTRPLPMRGPFDAIFCRNVTIYFDAETQDRLWNAFIGVMRPGSQLYIGHSERLSASVAPRFSTDCTTGFRLQAETGRS